MTTDNAQIAILEPGATEPRVLIPVVDRPLRFLHSAAVLSEVKLDQFRAIATAQLVESLRPGQSGALKARADGNVLEGHHRLAVLRERGVNIDTLPRELVARESES